MTYSLLAANLAVFLLFNVPLSGRFPAPDDPGLLAYLLTLNETFGEQATLQQLGLGITSLDLFLFEHGYRPVAPSVADLLSSMFLHASVLHLAGNMLFLWIYGDNVEARLGRVGYLFAYLGCGIVATLANGALDPSSALPLVGASGAISGVLGLYYLFFPRNQVKVLITLFPILVDVVMIPARFVLGIYVLFDNLLPYLASAAGEATGGVAHGAHLGGFFAGLGLAVLVRRRSGEVEPGADYPEGPAAGTRPAPVSLRDARSAEEAARLFFGLPRGEQDLLPVSEVLDLGIALRDEDPLASLSITRRVLARQPTGPLAARSHILAAALQLEAQERPAAAWQHLIEALDADPGGRHSDHARKALEHLEKLGHGSSDRAGE